MSVEDAANRPSFENGTKEREYGATLKKNWNAGLKSGDKNDVIFFCFGHAEGSSEVCVFATVKDELSV